MHFDGSTVLPNLACLSWACASAQGFLEKLLLYWLISVKELLYSGPYFKHNIWPELNLKSFQPNLFTTSFLQFFYSPGSLSESCHVHGAAKERVLCKAGLCYQGSPLEKVNTQPLSLNLLDAGCDISQVQQWLGSACSPAQVVLVLCRAAFPAAASSFSICLKLWVAKCLA